jgi:hypothetical protein
MMEFKWMMIHNIFFALLINKNSNIKIRKTNMKIRVSKIIKSRDKKHGSP